MEQAFILTRNVTTPVTMIRGKENLSLHGRFLGLGLLDLGHLGCRLGPERPTTPVTPNLFASLIEVSLYRLNQLVQGRTVVAFNLSDSEASGSLPPADTSQPGLILHNAIRNSHLATQGGEEHHHLDGVDIVSDHHQLGFLLLHKCSHVINSVTDYRGPLGRSILLA